MGDPGTRRNRRFDPVWLREERQQAETVPIPRHQDGKERSASIPQYRTGLPPIQMRSATGIRSTPRYRSPTKQDLTREAFEQAAYFFAAYCD